ncbi:MBL fold metallo-hydrolase [Rhodocyclus tenuis]|uniref:Ribonuclease BN (tRNA processing enzyme) n=1 Tax=Rhodocyclus tenuis TaxID=1066 RepID=A0A840G4N2_RHOTE|nr:3',5'-cyclic-nucleotide phosphodiesterase [Rhodocyclus tenuis]MBB4246865.1 ribonuclease BN (tRNA processing enzyme) [Rhodocyclus tenuis]
MKVRVLGCSGGIGGAQLRTTSLLVDHDILLDAGTGVCELSLAELTAINHVFLTHAHLDHIAALPLMLDSVADLRSRPLTVHACEATLESLRQHIFNGAIWPDFSEIPSREQPSLRFQPVAVGETVQIGGRRFTPVPADHSVPAVGYHLDSGAGSLVFTGDTTVNDAFWPVVNRIANLRYLIIETAFPRHEQELATVSKHLSPATLADELGKLERDAEIFITHLKPGQCALTMAEIGECAGRFKPEFLENNQILEF